MNEAVTSLASAYLDGHTTADERALVESDHEVMAEVERLRQVRSVLSDRESPSISIRERHLAEALDAWDRLPTLERTDGARDATPGGYDNAALAGAATLTAPARTAASRRWTQSTTWLGLAAAGLIVVMAGGLILRNQTTNDDANIAVEAETSGGTGADAVVADEPGDTELRLAESQAAPAAPTDSRPSENASDVETDLAAEAPPADTAIVVLEGREDLVDFASAALDAPSSGDLPDGASVVTEGPAESADAVPTPGTVADLPLCLGADRVVGPALYDDIAVIVGIDDGREVALAYRQDCSEVARASLR